jgi:hypothetical protein
LLEVEVVVEVVEAQVGIEHLLVLLVVAHLLNLL